jgi:hypothetical protein
MQQPSHAAKLVAIALVSSAVLLFETLVTRILSVTLHYHFVFLAISLSMLGLGAPGVWFSLRPPTWRALRVALFASALATPASVVVIVKVGAIWTVSVALVILSLLAPLLALGSAVCVLLVRAEGKRVAHMYAADLIGASLGAALVIPLLRGIPTPPLVASIAFLPLAALIVLDRRSLAVAVAASSLAATLVGLLLWGRPFALHYTKRYVETTPPLYEKWSPTARVTVFKQDASLSDTSGNEVGFTFFGWGMGTRFTPGEHEGLWLEQDGSAGTPIVRWSRDRPVPDFLDYDVTSIGYQLGRRLDRVAIVGGGGGRDILTARGAGARDIDVIELNSYIADSVRKEFADYSGDPYDLPGVHTTIGEGRSVLAMRDARYDLIEISLIDTFAATAAGAYALSENGLYTVEAFRLYYRRLTPSGVLSVSRWCEGLSRLESARLAIVAEEALAEEGVRDPRAHMISVQAQAVADLLVFREPVDAGTLAHADQVSAERGFVRLWPPPSEMAQTLVSTALLSGPDLFQKSGFDITPSTDDRPFFFQTIDLLAPPPPEVRARLGTSDPALLLRDIVLLLTACTASLFFVPLAFRHRWPRSPYLGRATAYFAAIGIAFMFVEIPMILRMTLYLGHPSRGAAVVLGALLLGAGIGSMTVARVTRRGRTALLAALPVVVLALALAFGPVAGATLSWSVGARAVVAIAALLPLGFVLGTAFPAGMILFVDVDRSWLWAVNGACSVLASVAALALAMVTGLRAVMVFGALAYVSTGLIWLGRGRLSAARPEPARGPSASPLNEAHRQP